MVGAISTYGRWARAPGFDEVEGGERVMRRGQAGEEVRELQRRLNDMKVASLDEDGLFGPKTEAALREAQRRLGVDDDGRLGKDTLGAMREVGAAPPPGTVSAGRLAADDEARRSSRRVLSYRASMKIDADGAPNVLGIREQEELGLSNAGMERRAAALTRETGVKHWFDPDKRDDTSLSYRSGGREQFLDADRTPFIVLPPDVAARSGAKKGDLALVRYGGKSVYAILGDFGPDGKIGEASMATARALGVNPDPRRGGVDGADVEYTVLPGTGAGIRARQHSFDEIQTAGEAAFRRAGLLAP